MSFPDKKEVVSAFLRKGNIFIHLDPRKAGVVVPPRFKQQTQIILQIGRDMAIPIPDLKLDEEGVHCTLCFSSIPFTCFLPWRAVFAVVGEDGKDISWKEDMPPFASVGNDPSDIPWMKDMPQVVADIHSKIKNKSSKVIDTKSKNVVKTLVKPIHLRLVK